jgi:branched-chain amino acid transport system permease protein
MQLGLEIIKTGFVLTAVYFLISFAVTFQYGVGGFPNLALGYVGALGAYVVSVLWNPVGPVLAILIGAVASIGFNLFLQKYIINKLARGRTEEDIRNNILYGTFALLVVIPPILNWLFPTSAITINISTGDRLFDMVTTFELGLIILAVAVFVAFYFIIKKTHFGHVIQAVTENSKLSAIMGINIRKVYLIVAAISGF